MIAVINGTAWMAATTEILHYFSMFILVGSMVIVDLRVSGTRRAAAGCGAACGTALSLDLDFVSVEFSHWIPHVRRFGGLLLPQRRFLRQNRDHRVGHHS